MHVTLKQSDTTGKTWSAHGVNNVKLAGALK